MRPTYPSYCLRHYSGKNPRHSAAGAPIRKRQAPQTTSNAALTCAHHRGKHKIRMTFGLTAPRATPTPRLNFLKPGPSGEHGRDLQLPAFRFRIAGLVVELCGAEVCATRLLLHRCRCPNFSECGRTFQPACLDPWIPVLHGLSLSFKCRHRHRMLLLPLNFQPL